MSSNQKNLNQIFKYENYSDSYLHIRERLLSDYHFKTRLNDIKIKNSFIKNFQTGKNGNLLNEKKIINNLKNKNSSINLNNYSNEFYVDYFKNNLSKSNNNNNKDNLPNLNLKNGFNINMIKKYDTLNNLGSNLQIMNTVNSMNMTKSTLHTKTFFTQSKFNTQNSLKLKNSNSSSKNLNTSFNHLKLNTSKISNTSYTRTHTREKAREINFQNDKIKMRLQKAKATSNLTREELKKSYEQTYKISERMRKIKPHEDVIKRVNSVKSIINYKYS